MTATWHHILTISTLMIERVSTLTLAILLLRLHEMMAKADNLDFMQKWVVKEKAFTRFVMWALIVALILTLINEISLFAAEHHHHPDTGIR